MTSFNSVLLAPAAAVRLARRRFPAHNGAADDLTVPPGWLNDLLERPLQMEAGWLGNGHRLGLGLSLFAVMRRPASRWPCHPFRRALKFGPDGRR